MTSLQSLTLVSVFRAASAQTPLPNMPSILLPSLCHLAIRGDILTSSLFMEHISMGVAPGTEFSISVELEGSIQSFSTFQASLKLCIAMATKYSAAQTILVGAAVNSSVPLQSSNEAPIRIAFEGWSKVGEGSRFPLSLS